MGNKMNRSSRRSDEGVSSLTRLNNKSSASSKPRRQKSESPRNRGRNKMDSSDDEYHYMDDEEQHEDKYGGSKSSATRGPSRTGEGASDRHIPQSPRKTDLASPRKKQKEKEEEEGDQDDDDDNDNVSEEEEEEKDLHPAAAAIADAFKNVGGVVEQDEDDDDDDEKKKKKEKDGKEDSHPAAAALQAALGGLKKNDDEQDKNKGGSEKPHPMVAALNLSKLQNNDNDDGPPSKRPPVNPMLAALNKTGGVPQLRPVFNPNDFSKASLNKTGGDKGGAAPLDGTARDVSDAKRCTREATVIYDHLRVSGDWCAKNKELLLECGVTHILNMAHTVCKNYHEGSGEFEYLALNVIDSANESIICFLLEAIVFIEKAREAGGVCYVHCHMGVSRSCTVVIAYVMLKSKLDFQSAFDLVKEKRPVCNPNAGFIGQLMEWDRQLREMPKGPQLYRVAKHSKIDPTLVVKLCTNPRSTIALTPNPNELDARGVFLLHDYKNRRFYIWCGPRCKERTKYIEVARKFGKWMIDLLPAFKKHKLRGVNTESVVNQSRKKNFWMGLGLSEDDAAEMNDMDVDQNLDKYDAEYGEGPVQSPKDHAAVLARRRSVDHPGMSTRNLSGLAQQLEREDSAKPVEMDPSERFKVQLYGWVDEQEDPDSDESDHEPTIESQWERIKNYDADDLKGESMFILLVHDRVEAKELKQGKKTIQRAFVWLGSLLEGRLNEQASIDKAQSFIDYYQVKTKSIKVETIIEHESRETRHFWEAFESGY